MPIIEDFFNWIVQPRITVKSGDYVGHPFRGNQYTSGGVSGIKINSASDALDALDTVGVPKSSIFGVYSNVDSAKSAQSHAAPRSHGRAPIRGGIVRLQNQYAWLHPASIDKALDIPDSEVVG